MSLPEQETIICINLADRSAGFFRFGTSRECEYRKLLRRTGGELVETRQSVAADGAVTWWECKVPIKFLSRTGWGVRKPGRPVGGFTKRA